MSNYYALIGAKVFNGYQMLHNYVVVVKNDLIENVISKEDFLKLESKDIEIINLQEDSVISAGFIDLQLNGCGGVLFNDDISRKTLDIMHQTNLKFGCTSFLPTLITCDEADIKKATEVVGEAYQENPSNILGIHIEGPYISKVKKGIHNPKYIKAITQEMVDFLIEQNKKVPIKITLAPEVNDISYIKQLVNAGVYVSIGHSNASYQEATKVIKEGVKIATHLFNAMSPMESRQMGVVGAILNSKDVSAGIIIDGYHVDFNAVELVKKIKKDKLYIVTDAVTPMGTDMEEFTFANQQIFVKNGKCINKEGTLAGANIDMIASVKNAVEYVGISLNEALKMASLYPARVMNKDLKLGKVLPEYKANLVIFDSKYHILFVVDNGKIIRK